MNIEPLGAPQRALINQYAAWLFAGGLLIGLVFTFEAIGHVVIWPLLPQFDFDFPGTEPGWRRAHLGAIVNSVAMLAFAAAGGAARMGARARSTYVFCVIVTGWGNSLGFLAGALFGVRGLEFGGVAANTINYLLFLVAAGTAFVQAILLALGSARTRRPDQHH